MDLFSALNIRKINKDFHRVLTGNRISVSFSGRVSLRLLSTHHHPDAVQNRIEQRETRARNNTYIAVGRAESR